MRRERRLVQHTPTPHVDDRPNRLVGVELERRGDAVVRAVHEDLEWQDAKVADTGLGVDAEDTREVALLHGQLRRTRQLAEEVRNDVCWPDPRAPQPDAEDRLRDMTGEDAFVVAKPAHHSRGARDAVLAQPLGRLRDVSGMVCGFRYNARILARHV